MVLFPNAKINLGLSVIEKRSDGFHNLETVFYPIQWTDALEVISSGDQPISLNTSGLSVDGDIANNLCYKAWELLAKDYTLPNLQAHLHKVLPMGAGLGGGSADAAFMLKMINEVANLGLTNEMLSNYASKLGSDCAFFIENKPVFADGRGDHFTPIELDLSNFYFVIVMPPVTVNTAEAYSWIRPQTPKFRIQESIKLPIVKWKDYLINDFEAPVIKKHPLIGEIKNRLYSEGAIYASMSGSGASVYGIFDAKPKLSQYKDCYVWNH
jgi:4-diphosphocytidyl-2-C-methyl-D-erythritol kinase